MRRAGAETFMEQSCQVQQRAGIRGFPFGAPATTSCWARGCGMSSNAPKGKPRTPALSRNSCIVPCALARRVLVPACRVPDSHGTNSPIHFTGFYSTITGIGQRVRIRRFPFGAPATTSCCTGGCGTSSNAPNGKRRIRTLSRDLALFPALQRPARRGGNFHGTTLPRPAASRHARREAAAGSLERQFHLC